MTYALCLMALAALVVVCIAISALSWKEPDPQPAS